MTTDSDVALEAGALDEAGVLEARRAQARRDLEVAREVCEAVRRRCAEGREGHAALVAAEWRMHLALDAAAALGALRAGAETAEEATGGAG